MKTISYLKGPVYISGPISMSPKESKYSFLALENFLAEAYHGLDIINPRKVQVPYGTSEKDVWEVMMRKSITSFLTCNSVVFLNGWERSRGALFEYMLAKHLNIPCFYFYKHDKTIGPLEFVSVNTVTDQLQDLIIDKCF